MQKKMDLRFAAQNEFVNDFFKLMNNAVDGKTVKHLMKRTDIKPLIDENKTKRLEMKPH